jgi:hypothetical protein
VASAGNRTMLSDVSLEVWSVEARSEELLSMIDACMDGWM